MHLVPSKKVLIMPSQTDPSREGVPPDPTPSVFNRGSEGNVQLQITYLLVSLGMLSNATKVLDDARKINDEKILQLFERTTKAETTLAGLEKTIDRNNTDLRATTERHATDLNGLGRVAHTAVSFGKLGLAVVAGGLLAELFRYLLHH